MVSTRQAVMAFLVLAAAIPGAPAQNTPPEPERMNVHRPEVRQRALGAQVTPRQRAPSLVRAPIDRQSIIRVRGEIIGARGYTDAEGHACRSLIMRNGSETLELPLGRVDPMSHLGSSMATGDLIEVTGIRNGKTLLPRIIAPIRKGE